VLFTPSGNCAKRKIPNRSKGAIIRHNHVMDYKSNENAIAGIGRFNFPVVNGSVTAKVRKVDSELADFL